MSIASVASQQAAAAAAAQGAASGITGATSSTSTSSGTGSSSTSQSALQSLSGNFNDFLNLLMTQLQYQDPTSPMDTTQFTSQLVQFASVAQQINTNSSLTQLIQLTQGNEILQSSSMVGKQVTVTSDHIPLQNGKGEVQFTATGNQPVAIAIYNDAGTEIREAEVTASQGTNTWTWDGTDNNGNQVADGSYRIAVMGANADGSTSALNFSVIGTATGVVRGSSSSDSTSTDGSGSSSGSTGSGITLQLGALGVDFSAVQSVGN
ncbi:MAG TPA: flagellar hook assembly protein FlgD [Acetobacteraceae bacterium]|nr:flagellar hook assembly protein FlgD [Acetobacteraceae bacterium]